jgi:hypothetical protein
VISRVGEHVVPLEHLVQHDAVDEAAEADSHQEGGRLGGIAGGRIEPAGA